MAVNEILMVIHSMKALALALALLQAIHAGTGRGRGRGRGEGKGLAEVVQSNILMFRNGDRAEGPNHCTLLVRVPSAFTRIV